MKAPVIVAHQMGNVKRKDLQNSFFTKQKLKYYV